MSEPMWQIDRTRELTVEDVIDLRRFTATQDLNILVDLLLRWLATPRPSRAQLLKMTIPQMAVLQMAFVAVLKNKSKDIDKLTTDLSQTLSTATH